LPVHQLEQTALHLESNVMSQRQGTYSNTAFPLVLLISISAGLHILLNCLLL
jgi:hypothetical protein